MQERQAVANDYGLQLSADNKFIINETSDFKNFLDFIGLKSVCKSGARNIYKMNSATKQKDAVIASFFFVNWCDYADSNCRPIA